MKNVCNLTTNYTLTYDGYYGTEFLYFNCSTGLIDIDVRFIVQKTVGATYAKQYNSFTPNLIQSYNETESYIVYRWFSSPSKIYTTDSYATYTEAQFQLKGINQTIRNDIYYATFTIACNDHRINITGHFS